MTYSRRTWSNGNAWDATAANDFEGRIETEFGVKATEIAARALQTSVDSADAALDARVDALEAGGGGGGGGGTVTLDTWHTVGGAGEPAFLNSWVAGASSAVEGVPQFRKYPDGKVRLRGTLQGGAANSAAFVLPAGYWPPKSLYIPVVIPSGVHYVYIDATNGQVRPQTATSESRLGPIEFDTDTVSSLVFGPGPSAVTSLPGGPIDGQEVYYIADSTNGVIWHLRYRSASGSSFKWEFVGGQRLFATVDTVEGTTSSGAYADLTTVGPQVTVPLAGDYLIEFGADVNMSVGGVAYFAPKLGAATAVDADSAKVQPGTTDYTTIQRTIRRTGLAASAVIKVQYKTSAGNANFGKRGLYVTPVRVG